MKFEKAPSENVGLLERAMEGLPMVERKTMFGYAAYFAGGKLSVGLFADGVCMKLSPEDRAKALAVDGVTEFAPMHGRVMREYVFFTRSALENASRLRKWAEKSVAYTLGLGGATPRAPKAAAKPATRATRRKTP